MNNKLEKELEQLSIKRNKLSKFLSKQNKQTVSANQLKLRIKDLKEAK